MWAMPSWASARPTWLGLSLSIFAPGLGGVEVVAGAVGVERARQALGGDHFEQAREARGRALLGDQEGRVNLGGRVVEGDDQVERCPAFEPSVGRAVLVHHHADQGPPWPLAPMCPAPGCLGHQPGRVQLGLGPGVAPAEPVMCREMIVEVLDCPANMAGAVLFHHPGNLIDRDPAPRGLAQATVEQAIEPFALEAHPPAPERPLAHPQYLRRLNLAQFPNPDPIQQTLELLHPKLL